MKVLIAEDEPVSRHLLETFLGRWGYEVVAARDGEEAWWILQREDAPKLAILDWMMPGKDGLEVCREIRKRVDQPYIYILLLTAKTQKQDIVKGLESGADDYLTKPFDFDELRARLRAGRRILDLQDQLLSATEAARFPTTHDLLTGVWNREAILGILRQLSREGRPEGRVSVILASLDHFKQLNQACGSRAADAVLREAARRMRSVVRIYDSIGRYGEGDFLIIAPGCDSSEVVRNVEKLCASIAAEPVDFIGGAIPITLSIGVATTADTKAGTAQSLLRAAATAVYRAKLRGGNRVEVATEGEVTEPITQSTGHVSTN